MLRSLACVKRKPGRLSYLRVRLRSEEYSLPLQLPPQLRGIVDRPVVHQGDAVVEVHVGVGILIGLPA